MTMRMRRIVYSWIWIILGILPAAAQQREEQVAYIQRYLNLAVWEMERTGVPASIKLGQAVLESRWGTTDLARIANNHFGIKCGGVWKGPSYDKEDDEYDANKRLIPSCFRQYESAEESYVAHSEFLKDPLKTDRYGFLFELDPLDYKAWARGLKKAGYATDKEYHHKLIRIIENLELYRYDLHPPDEIALEKAPPEIYKYYTFRRRSASILAPVAVIVYKHLEHPSSALRPASSGGSEKKVLPVHGLLSYNASLDHPVRVLKSKSDNAPMPQRNSYKGTEEWHQVRPNELMADISRSYGIKLSTLYRRNLLPDSSEVVAGERVKLKGARVDKAPVLRPALQDENGLAQSLPLSSSQSVSKNDPFSRPSTNKPISKPASGGVGLGAPISARPSLEPVQVPAESEITEPGFVRENQTVSEELGPKIQYHVVRAGETLWSIARQYGISTEDLKQLNELKVDTIVSGTALRVR